WPLRANTHDGQPLPLRAEEAACLKRLPDLVAQFLNDMGAFLRKWGLMQLSTWDLPVPQGILEGLPLGLTTHLLGPNQAVTTVPPYYDVPSATDVRAKIRSMQKQEARSAGISSTHPISNIGPRDGRASSYEAAFRLWLVERTVRRRYGPRRGLSSRLTDAFAT